MTLFWARYWKALTMFGLGGVVGVYGALTMNPTLGFGACALGFFSGVEFVDEYAAPATERDFG